MKTATSRRMYTDFMGEFDSCWNCGWKLGDFCPGWHLPQLHNAHILGGPNRSHDRRNINRLCEGCHRLAHRAVIRIPGHENPLDIVDLAGMMWLKKTFDPDFYSRKYLIELGGKNLPYARSPRGWHGDSTVYLG
jgi:hypothetical protein